MKRVYIAGPYTNGDPELNVINAIDAAEVLSHYGLAAYIPHLSHYWDKVHPHDYQFWIDLDNAFLPVCDALLRIPGASKGADGEVLLAEKLGIPVFYAPSEVVRALG